MIYLNKKILLIIVTLFIGVMNVNAVGYYCNDGMGFPITRDYEKDYELNQNVCKYKWTNDKYIKLISETRKASVIEMKNFYEYYIFGGYNTNVANLIGDSTLESLLINLDNQKWVFTGSGSITIKKGVVSSTSGDTNESKNYESREELLEFADRFIETDLSVTITDEGYLKIGGSVPQVEVLNYANDTDLLNDIKNYADPDFIDSPFLIRKLDFYNEAGEIIAVPDLMKSSPGYIRKDYQSIDVFDYYLTLSLHKYIGDEIVLGNYLHFKFYNAYYTKLYKGADDELVYNYRIKLTKDMVNHYINHIQEHSFLIIQDDMHDNKRIYNKLFLNFYDTSKDDNKDDMVVLNSDDTNIKIFANEFNLDSDTVLIASIINDENKINNFKTVINDSDSDKLYKAFDISLYDKDDNDVGKQPFGYIKISIPIPSNMNKDNISVYRIDDEGNKVEYIVEIDGDNAIIETNHFSNYVMVGDASYTKGDMNYNNRIDLKDIILLIKKYLGTDHASDLDITIGDMNNNGKLDLKDIIILIRTYLGLEG